MIDEYNYSNKETLKLNIREFINTIYRRLRKLPNTLSFSGKYDSWSLAQKRSVGYDSDAIFDKVMKASLEVKKGNACYERDSYLFHTKHYNYPLLSFMLEQYLKDGYLHILDFGGSLGSMYFQNKSALDKIGKKCIWTVVEQTEMVKFGKKELQDDNLRFEYRMEDVQNVNVVLFGSSLQYIENYLDYVFKAIDISPDIILIDKTPMSDESWYSIEYVHEPIYEASYPLKIMNQMELVNIFKDNGYNLEQEWIPEMREEFRINSKKCIFKSMMFIRKSN